MGGDKSILLEGHRTRVTVHCDMRAARATIGGIRETEGEGTYGRLWGRESDKEV